MNIQNIISSNKKIIILAVFAILCVIFIGKLLSNNHPKIHVSMSTVLQKTKEIDKLYTGVYIIPAVDKKYGRLKRDMVLGLLNSAKELVGLEGSNKQEDKKVVKGYCKKRYEVSVGYNNLSELLSNQDVIYNACHGNTEKLPNPEILAVNCRNTETRGDYNGNDICFRWDNDEKMRKSLLTAQMKNNNILEKVNKRGRESLKTIANIFCE